MNQFRSDAVGLAASMRDTRQYLERVARAAVPAAADLCLVYLLDGEQLRCAASAHATRRGDRLLRDLNRVYRITQDDHESTVAQVVRLRRPSLRSDIRPEHQALEPPVAGPARVFDIHRQLAAALEHAQLLQSERPAGLDRAPSAAGAHSPAAHP